MLRVLVACEFSGIVRTAFAKRGHTAVSVDLLPAEDGAPDFNNPHVSAFGSHYQGDITEFLSKRTTPLFDLMIAHPPCTHLAVSGARWFKDKKEQQSQAVAFAAWLIDSPFINIPRICVENPVGILSSRLRKPDQIIQPWQFGHGEVKATCLWLKNLPPLVPTKIVEGREARVHRASPGPDRWKERSRTLEGIADAMADQWGSLPSLRESRCA
jgi:site-specific DNA-cytosine methylase